MYQLFKIFVPSIVTTSFCLLFFSIQSAYGIGLITVDKQVFDDTPEGFILNIEGTINEQIPVGRNSITLDFLEKGFWITTIEIDYDPSGFSDRLSTTSISRHLIALHTEDDGISKRAKKTISVTFPFSELDNSFLKENTESFTDRAAHGKHSDIYFGHSFIQGENGNIKNWKYNLIGTHRTVPIPEPLTILGTATALGFGAFFKRKLKSSESSEKETINVK
jgi:hypothetical protein